MQDIIDNKVVKVYFKISQPDLMRLGTGLDMEVIHNKVFITKECQRFPRKRTFLRDSFSKTFN